MNVHKLEKRPPKSFSRELEDIVFTEAHARWVYHPHNDVLVIMMKIGNTNVHRMLVGNGSAVDILYLDAFKRMRLKFPLYSFIDDHLMPRGTRSCHLALRM